MEWLGLQLFAELPADGQIILDCHHNPFLVVLAYVVAGAACFATLDMADRQIHSEERRARRQWKGLGACCLASGIWAMHFISLLAFKPPLEVHYDMVLTALSLMIALIAAWLAMNSLDRLTMQPRHYLQAALAIGIGITVMHYMGMAALQTSARQYYQTPLLLASVGIAIVTSLVALLVTRRLGSGTGPRHLMTKYGAALIMAAGIVFTHYTGMAALSLVLPDDEPLRLPSADNSLQLGLSIAFITLLISASSISAALADKKLQSKEHDLRRVNVLLSQLDQARASLQQAAHYDALTNLVNRRGFNQVFAERLAEHAVSGSMLAVMFLDIDHFKRINDSLGHDAGDELLKVIATHIRAATRSQDLVARFGGDEFCIVTSLHNRDEACRLGQRIMQRMKEPIDLGGRRMVMTTSIGISIFPDDGRTAEELLKNADLALYQSKGSGRNHLNFFDNSLKTRATLELQLEEALRVALVDACGLCVHYQPIFDLRQVKVSKLEALVRWNHPQHGMIGPDRFIAIAEANGLIAELDLWVLRRACRDLAELGRQGHGHLKVSVNCSTVTLGREELADDVERALLQAGVAPWQLELEVTENALMGDIHRTIGLLERLRSQGVTLSIDDFGTGYSSLAYLKRLPLDVLKIDRSFIQDVMDSQQDREIVQAILMMAHTLHLQVVTEGVETEEQLAFLAAHDCDGVQGFLLSRPVPMDELPAVLARLDRPDSVLIRACGTAGPRSLDRLADAPERRAGASAVRRGR
ncbi:EAL domain-containing protein [Pseudomonas sp. S75]|uniref:putative bifunctional diguanylate cyclase/phosphodiesterase n=1 Tax=unclassified Pseudomonas TaxID=196821 RepID=UPI001907A33E|nr:MULTISPECIES: EAL domain-containing protein [unclassified Pseudomonas]MBJ9975928.1 EAL domain-containing protein [Pseudomonas sp. S30]MBK0153650.1 EAL domain-containing protein [Pseudomonas sp. S75]